MSIRELIIGGIITVTIGGTAYSFSKEDVVNNFADDTGVTQQQAEDYVNNIKESDLVPYTEIGNGFIKTGNETLITANGIDCVNYKYEWESSLLTCAMGKSQLAKIGQDEVKLGNAYLVLDSEAATKTDISTTVLWLGIVNTDYDLPIASKVWSPSDITETKKTNSYNKATLQAALQSTD